MQDSISLGLTQNDVPTTSDDYYTPPWIFESLGLTFDTDPASPVGGIPWIPVKRYYSLIDDGLSQEWVGRVWLNPPFSKPSPWVEKFIHHNNGILLAPTSGNGRWLNDIFNEATAILLLPPSIKFMRNKTNLMPNAIPIRCALFAMGEENAEALRKTGFGKVR